MQINFDKLPKVTIIMSEELEEYVSKAVIGDVFFCSINDSVLTKRYMCYCTEEIICGDEEPCWLRLV